MSVEISENSSRVPLLPGSYQENVEILLSVFPVTALTTRVLFLTLWVIVGYYLFSSRKDSKFTQILSKKLNSFINLVMPDSLPLIGSSHLFAWHGKELTNLLGYWAKKYDKYHKTSIAGRKLVILNDVTLVQKLFTSTDLGHLYKSSFFYNLLHRHEFLNGLLTSPVELWKPHRAILSKAFTYDALKSYMPILNHHSKGLISELTLSCGGSLSVNTKEKKHFEELVHIYALRIIANVITGMDILNDDEGLEFHNIVYRRYRRFARDVVGPFGIYFARSTSDTLFPKGDYAGRFKEISSDNLFNPFFQMSMFQKWNSASQELDKCSARGATFIKNLIIKRSKDNEAYRKSDLSNSENENGDGTRLKTCLDILLDANVPSDEILSEVLTFVVAGHETVSGTLLFVMSYLALYPEHQKACHKEVDSVFEGTHDDNSPQPEKELQSLSLDSLNQLKYLEMCIKETLRIIPIVPALPRELKTPFKLNETEELEVGTIILGSVWAIHRNPNYYTNPENFEPDRFLPENAKKRSIYTHIPFSTGPRNCIGWKLAMMEMKMFVAWILRNFEVHTTNTLSDVNPVLRVVLCNERPMNLELRKRSRCSSQC